MKIEDFLILKIHYLKVYANLQSKLQITERI